MGTEKLLSYPWAISGASGTREAYGARLLQLIKNPLTAEQTNALRHEDISQKHPQVFRGKDKQRVRYSDFENEDGENDRREEHGEIYGSVGIVYLQGPMLYHSDMCMKGIDAVIEELQQMGNNPRIAAVLMVVDSPGGSVTGVETLSNVVTTFKATYGKRIHACIIGSACSAAYYAICGADNISFMDSNGMAGSIGTMVTLMDIREYLDMNGIKEITVNASLSTNKNKAFDDAINGDAAMLRNNLLDPINQNFLRSVQRNRGRKLGNNVPSLDFTQLSPEQTPEVLTGQVYVGQKAIDAGLVDRIERGGLMGALDYLQRWVREDAPPAEPIRIIENRTEPIAQHSGKLLGIDEKLKPFD